MTPPAVHKGRPAEPVGTFCLVLHTHLPWVAHAGVWPVGEEWFHQAFTGAWRRVVTVLDALAAEGHRDVLSLGVTPITAAMLDDPYMLRELHTWIGNWQLRAQFLAGRPEPDLRRLAGHEYREATEALTDVEARWLHGGSAVLRPLVDAGVIELLGGPATHPFQPLLEPRVQRFALRVGLDDARMRFGAAPEAIWAPECGYAPGLEAGYAAHGVRRFVVDGPTLHGDTALGRPVGDADVVAFGRDLDVTYRVWSPRSGYPGDPAYRDFHTFDHPSGFRPARVTGRNVAPEHKRPWEPSAAALAVERHADDFVNVVRERLTGLRARLGRSALVLAAFDTELFGHWWYEGPAWLGAVLRRLPGAGVQLTTLRGAVDAGLVGEPVELPAGSWGSGKDWRVWAGDQGGDLLAGQHRMQERLLALADKHAGPTRDPALDQAVREALLALSSDWAFMVTKNSAADYARGRVATHTARFDRLAELIESGRDEDAESVAAVLRRLDGAFGHLDARLL